MKSYIELEEIAIVGTYVHNMHLCIITKGGMVWQYEKLEQKFTFKHRL